MAKRSGYLDRKKAEIGVYRQAEKDTYIQFMSDMWQITLNDPEIMGRMSSGRREYAASRTLSAETSTPSTGLGEDPGVRLLSGEAGRQASQDFQRKTHSVS